MNDATFSRLSNSQLHDIDEVVEQFESMFARGDQPSIEVFLDKAEADIRPYLLTELLAVEIELRKTNGDVPSHRDYADRFDDHQPQRDDVLRELGVVHEAAPATMMFAGDETDDPSPSDPTSLTLVSHSPSAEVARRTPSFNGGLVHDATEPIRIPRRFGRYEIKRVLGKGGMGTVYLAHDSELDRDVALKVPEFNVQRDGARAADRFRREAKSMATVHHPNLCPVYDVGEIDSQLYLTMAFINGPTLHERILRPAHESNGPKSGNVTQGAFDEVTALEFMAKLARAVQFAHNAGIVHRDLKPSNVMMNELGEPVVMDFGLALRCDADGAESTQEGRVIGTPLYMAPEQVEGDRNLIGPRSDIYALGVILYHMLCGQPPFQGSVYSILGKTAAGTPPPPPSEVAGISPEVEAVVLKAMAWDIDTRYQTADEFADAIEAVAKAKTGIERAGRPHKRGVMLGVAGTIAALLAVVVYVVRGMGVEVKVTAPEGVDIELRLTGEGRVISITSGDGWSVRAKPGMYEMSLHAVNGAVPNDVQFAVKGGNTLIVSRGKASEVTIVRREIEPKAGEFSVVHTPVRFADSGQRIGDNHTTDVALIDVNGDGALDAVRTPFQAGARNQIWLNNGQGVLELSPTDLGTTFTTSVRSSDVDLDGDADLFLPAHASQDELWINNGRGEFTRRQLPFRSKAAEFCDADGDGDPDLLAVVSDPTDEQGVVLLLNNGKGEFEDSLQRLGNWPRDLVVGDVDGDGDQDFVAVNDGADDVWLNDGQGLFFRHPVTLADPVPTQQFAMGDLDGDGDFDLVAAVMHSANVVWFNDGKGGFEGVKLPGIQTSKAVALSDVDGDRDLDIIFGDADPRPDSLWLNDGKGNFEKPIQWFADLDTQALAVGDLNGDGREDLYLGHGLDRPDRIWWNSIDFVPPKSPDTVEPTKIAESRRHRRPRDVAFSLPEEKRARDQRHAFVLKLELLQPEDLNGKSPEQLRGFLISYLDDRCGDKTESVQSQTVSDLTWNIRMHAWLATLEARDAQDLVGYTLDEQRNLAISIIAPMLDRGRELQRLTNAELMKLMDVFPAKPVEPIVTRIARQVPETEHTNADTLVFRLTFNRPVQNVSEQDFAVVGSTAAVTGVRKLSTLQFDVTVSGGDLADFNGELTLQVQDETKITDLEGRGLVVSRASQAGSVRHESYTLDNTAPTVAITRATPKPSGLVAKDSVTFSVKFSEPVVGPRPHGLVSHFAFEDSFADGVDGQLAAPHGDIRFGKGRFGMGIVLDGRDHLRVLKDVTQETLPQMSWGAWAKLANVRGDEHCVQVLCVDDANPADFDRSLAADARDSGGRLQWSAFHGGQPAGVGTSGVNAKAGEWTFIAATYDNDKSLMTLYVNDTRREMSTAFTSGHKFFDIGSNPFFGEFFQGTIDDVFVFNRALDKREIERIRDNGFALSPDAFEVITTGFARGSDTVTITDADDSDPSTFTVTIAKLTGEGAINLLLKKSVSDLAGNPLSEFLVP